MILNYEDIQNLLPHRAPILLIREVRDLVPGEKGTGVRRFEESDICFEGHFPGRPVLPGVLVTEACAQTAMVVFLSKAATKPAGAHFGVLARIEKMQFLEMIVPPVEVSFNISVTRRVGPFAYVACTADAAECRFAKGEIVVKLVN